MARICLVIAVVIGLAPASALAGDVALKDLGRFLGWRDNVLVGYGVVTGLSGSGDSPRNAATQQALQNALGRLGANVPREQVQSRNVAAVMVTATLPPSSHVGDKLDVTVSSVGDARSLAGGTLLMTPLLGPDRQPYALAQGGLVVGGYRFDADQNTRQSNYPTSATVPGGATVETPVRAELVAPGQPLTFVLDEADATTAVRVADSINARLGYAGARVTAPDTVAIEGASGARDLYRLVAQIEQVRVVPEALARIVVNERTGTVVAGEGVQISSVVVSQGDIRLSVDVENLGLQPAYVGGDSRGLVVTNTRMAVSGARNDAMVRFPNTTVGDLVEGLRQVKVDTRGIIAVLQAVKAAGALHAEIIVQ